MFFTPWTLLILAITAEVIGTSFLRLSEGMTRPVPTLLVFSAYAIAMGLLSKVVGFALYTCIYLYLGCIRHNTRICLYFCVSLGIGSTKV